MLKLASIRMRFHKIYCIFFILASFGMFSQETIEENEKQLVPISIFTLINKSTEINSTFSINNKLNLNSYRFVFLDEKKIKEGYFTIPIERMDRTPSKFIYETYANVYHQLNMEKSFFKVSDLYRLYIPHK
ncbi:hypothetical protein SAMN04488111_2672 [Lutibacter flavus]|uniref:Uncharacterized protein n=2 Tax=Lutibacter flavus TaxID=691689 RepID=A0A238YM21_9FLAO|nr:hypothetical protein SAMN04488111_2672 [Lutibacter flavus]